jgi:hypothetical protein
MNAFGTLPCGTNYIGVYIWYISLKKTLTIFKKLRYPAYTYPPLVAI